MNILEKFREVYGPRHNADKPEWCQVVKAFNNGYVLLNDGTTVRKLYPLPIQAGDFVLVWREYILQIKSTDATPFVFSPIGTLIILARPGDTTGDYSKALKYYDRRGNQIVSLEWSLSDDGKYGIIVDANFGTVNPYENGYAYDAGGLGIPYNHNGQPAKQQRGLSVRYVLNNSLEDELWTGHQVDLLGLWSYIYLYQSDSIFYKPLAARCNKPFFTRYLDDSVLHGNIIWSGTGVQTLTFKNVTGNGFGDSLPDYRYVYRKNFYGGSTAFTLPDYVSPALKGLVAVQATGDPETQIILQARVEDLGGGSIVVEPVQEKILNIPTGVFTSGNKVSIRCTDTNSCYCWYEHGDIVSGREYDGSGRYTATGYATIATDISLPFSVNNAGKIDRVRIEKDAEYTKTKTGIYCADSLIEESVWENSEKLFDQTEALVHEKNAPIILHKTRYRILHAHHTPKFDAVIYRKTVYQSHSAELLPYCTQREFPPIYLTEAQIRRVCVISRVSYHISVNGKSIELPYSAILREYMLTVLSEAYTGDPGLIQGHPGIIHSFPWVDAGYNSAGEKQAAEHNCVITRIFTDATENYLLLGYDVFPVEFWHELAYENHAGNDILYPKFNTGKSGILPPASDAKYEKPYTREWKLFDMSGMVENIPAPTENRINGMMILER